MPRPELTVDEPLVRRLLASLPEHLGHLRDQPVSPVAQGWDNAVWLVGAEDTSDTAQRYAVRVPVRAVATPLIDTAARWSAEAFRPVAEAGIRLPRPVHRGTLPQHPSTPVPQPGNYQVVAHPWPWFLVEWVPGVTLDQVPVADRGPVGAALAEVLPRLHRTAPPDAPLNPARGTSLRDRRRFTARHLPEAETFLGRPTVEELLAVIDAAEAAVPWPGSPVWCHGDLHDLNLALDGTTLGILDLDDLTSGDPAVDLRALWICLDGPTRAEATGRLEASGAYDVGIWERARGWAASSFVLPIAADKGSRPRFAPALAHTVDQLLGGSR